jgi:hypothetical protein
MTHFVLHVFAQCQLSVFKPDVQHITTFESLKKLRNLYHRPNNLLIQFLQNYILDNAIHILAKLWMSAVPVTNATRNKRLYFY